MSSGGSANPVESLPLLAAVIPTYNRGRSLQRCLDSVYQQTRTPDEVILVDDGSTDGSTEGLETRYPGLRVIRQPNRGVSPARNAGIRAAQSRWIAFLDSDDRWLEEKCERQLEVATAHPEPQIVHCQERWIHNGVEKRVPDIYWKNGGWIFNECLPRCAISPSTAMIRKDLLESVGLFDESLPACEDYDLWLRITCDHPVALVDETLVEKHGGHDDQLSRQRGLDKYRIAALAKFLASHHPNNEYNRAARATLLEKCAIVVNGAKKRGDPAEATRFQSIADAHRQSLR